MGHAWLDSLSEDWVSQNGSETSQCVPAESTKSSRKSNGTMSSKSSGRSLGSVRHLQAQSPANSSNVLSERSANEINIFSSRRGQSKLSQELKRQDDAASMAGSVIHNTVERNPHGISPSKNDTPEWRRRLVNGEVGFGEQQDLFSPTRLGLANMFQPPAAPSTVDVSVSDDEHDSLAEDEQDGDDVFAIDGGHKSRYDSDELRNNTTMPSSPPISQRLYDLADDSVDESVQELPRQPQFQQTADQSEMPIFEETGEGSVLVNRSTAQTADSTPLGSQIHIPMEHESRILSGQSVLRNESFSAILISPEKKDGNGAVFGPVELPPGELKRRLENLRWNQMALGEKPGESALNESVQVGGKSLNADTTEEYEKMGGFINFRRGGRSAEGSFRHRMLSSSLEADTSEMLPEESLQASTPKQFPTIRTEKATLERPAKDDKRSLPRAPNPSPEKLQVSSAGSPLKLFGPYDTFTNQTLMRRISQFEDQLSNGSQASADPSIPDEDEPGSSELGSVVRGGAQQPRSRQSSAQFGGGELDGYSFGEEFSVPEQGPSIEKMARMPYFSEQTEDDDKLHVQRQRSGTVSSSRSHPSRPGTARSKQNTVDADGVSQTPATPRRSGESGSEKRARTSPSKDPTPKRRRTLHKSDIAFGVEDVTTAMDSVHESHHNMQSVMGRNRRDVREGDTFQSADTDVLASRAIRWPHGPTSSRHSSGNHNHDLNSFLGSEDDAEGHVDDIHGSPASRRAVSSVTGPMAGNIRKPSIRTEDYMNEAQEIMAMLRNRTGGPQSGLASVEESEMETPRPVEQDDEDGSFQESTREPFSRPPSREGKPVPRVARVQEDPEVVARLKQYAERSDMDDLVTSTARSISLAQDAILAERQAAEVAEAARVSIGSSSRGRTRLDDSVIISDPPNMRISENPNARRRSGSMDAPSSLREGMGSQASTSSVPTGSSRGSDSRKTIAPQTVSHLIPDQVGNMMLDRNNNIWIKRRNGNSGQHVDNSLPSEGSEDDPFADIPDLSVDMTEEMQNLKKGATAAPTTMPELAAAESTMVVPDEASTVHESLAAEDREVEHEISIDESRVHSPVRKRHLAISFSSPIASIIRDFVTDEDSPADHSVERSERAEVATRSVKRGRRTVSVQFKSTATGTARPRNTPQGPLRTFSVGGRAFVPRPVSRIDEREEAEGGVEASNHELSVMGERSVVQDQSSSVDHSVMREQSLAGDRSVMQERSVVVSMHGDDEDVMAQYVGMLSLSPMSEFTMHQERSLALEASYVLGPRHLVTGDETTAVMSQSLQRLVARLAEVEPSEPYWEELEALDVQEKQLESLHKLDEFCPRLVTLDAGANGLRSLSGVPASVRHLRVVDNQLSELTAWGRLANLQYVDVSHNAVRTLAGLKGLVHLRGLRADHCGLTELVGLQGHDGLQTLRARGNAIPAVDFTGTRLQRLAELDLENNELERVDGLGALEALAVLNLRGNRLRQFGRGQGVLAQVRTLNVSDNALEALDVGQLAALRTLVADRNRLTGVQGLRRTVRLDSLSVREQRLASTQQLDVATLYAAYEVRKLYLSGNRLDAFAPPVALLNLQLLELANCGLAALPARFGLGVPNLRKLNLNWNGLADLRCLAGIPRLKKLLVAGNRLRHAYAAVEVLASFAHLAEADLRDNPLTQGFYSIARGGVVEKREKKARGDEAAEKLEPFVLCPGDRQEDAAYCERLDLATGMRRRVYEQVVSEACGKLLLLDGLAVRRDLGAVRDAVWEALNARGIVGDSKGERKEGDERSRQTDQESRWGAEDTFA